MGIWRDRFRFRRWGKWILAGGAGFVALGTISVEATSTSSFCNSCHIMEPYYTSWKHSTHKNVECVACHIAPGAQNFMAAKLNGLGQVVDDVLHRTSNKPSASVSQFSCTRSGCHTQETLRLKSINTGKFKFGHDKHLGAKHLGVEISCTTCHSHVKGDSHFEVNTSVCLTCHLIGDPVLGTQMSSGREEKIIMLSARNSQSKVKPVVAEGEKVPPSTCLTCHDAPSKEIEFQGLKFNHSQFLGFGASCESCHQSITATPPPIEDGRCLECHNFGVERATSSREMHRTHTLGEKKVECSSCHGTIRHGLNVKARASATERLDCNKCHIDQHSVQQNTYFHVGQGGPAEKGITGAEAAHSQNVMFMAHVDCTGCHTKARALTGRPDGGAIVLAASPESCNKCHQPGFGEQMIPLWQKTTHGLYDEALARYDTAIAAGATPESLIEVKTLLDGVKSDGSWGVHNPRYIQKLLEDARALLTHGGKAVPAAAATPPAAAADGNAATPKPAAPAPANTPGTGPATLPPGAPR